jgi:hypothetical protein
MPAAAAAGLSTIAFSRCREGPTLLLLLLLLLLVMAAPPHLTCSTLKCEGGSLSAVAYDALNTAL